MCISILYEEDSIQLLIDICGKTYFWRKKTFCRVTRKKNNITIDDILFMVEAVEIPLHGTRILHGINQYKWKFEMVK